MGKRRITASEFKDIKSYLRWHGAKKTAEKYNYHLSTILNIKGCKEYIEYQKLVKSEHEPVADSLKDRVMELHRMTFQKRGITYFEPRSARVALTELQLRQIKLNRSGK